MATGLDQFFRSLWRMRGEGGGGSNEGGSDGGGREWSDGGRG